MYRSPSTFRHILTRVIVYLLMTVAVGCLVIGSLIYILGYRFDNKNHRIERSGLVQYITKPSGAEIAVDSIQLSQRTPTNTTVSSGRHTFTFTRGGYQTWEKTLTIKPGTLTWLNYARLIPNDIAIESVSALPQAAQALATPGRQYMAVLTRSDRPAIQVYDLTGDTVRTSTMTASADEYDTTKTSAKHVFQMVEWDDNDRYLLVKHTHGKVVEWLVFDRQTGKLISNVTKTMDVVIRSAHIIDQGGPVVVALIDDDIRKIDLNSETVSRPLVSRVDDFSVFGDDAISYVSAPDETTKQRAVGLLANGGKPVVVYTSKKGEAQPIHVVSGHYFDKDYIAISDGKQVILQSGTFPAAQTDAANLRSTTVLTFPTTVESLKMSPENRFVVAQTGATFQTYDIERAEPSALLELGSAKSPRQVDWLDNYYIWSDSDKTLQIEEFDGANRHVIGPVAPGFDAVISPDGKYLYSIGSAAQGFQLQRVKLLQ
jgi:hypothetical protein